MTTASMIAIAGYIALMLPCLAAAGMARIRMPEVAHARRWWTAAAAFFLLLAAIRVTGLEDIVRVALRELLERNGDYAGRWYLQAPFAVLGIFALAIVPFMTWRFFGRGRVGCSLALVRLAQLGMLGFLPLMILRVVSFHATDRLLYRGSIRMNWVLEGGLSLVIGLSAAVFAIHCLRIGKHPQRAGGERGDRRR